MIQKEDMLVSTDAKEKFGLLSEYTPISIQCKKSDLQLNGFEKAASKNHDLNT